eukprot:CAMPEP_0172569120 /NCGR_PEP_ID=MMETSP1067-20121228/122319_1 /TAXON_ID=265564 ORGANISM="Thalassiosira punctigera, Strain Tpunct2005C2" /NCGR_SAMPLE_ID=MMETSP1067 /ASSEMBLY_ACC=CAM_ASM_000444 /LENGTH=71 /DNA_ID=CAMNT_0013360883 /DNA_START=181 /DNA_END=396 /DNA_ORIENTATION=-
MPTVFINDAGVIHLRFEVILGTTIPRYHKVQDMVLPMRSGEEAKVDVVAYEAGGFRGQNRQRRAFLNFEHF